MDKKKLRYAILKEIDKDNKILSNEKFGVSYEDFFNQVSFLVREGYMTKPIYASNKIFSFTICVITEKGEDYLESNSTLSKSYTLAKEIRGWIKL